MQRTSKKQKPKRNYYGSIVQGGEFNVITLYYIGKYEEQNKRRQDRNTVFKKSCFR